MSRPVVYVVRASLPELTLDISPSPVRPSVCHEALPERLTEDTQKSQALHSATTSVHREASRGSLRVFALTLIVCSFVFTVMSRLDK